MEKECCKMKRFTGFDGEYLPKNEDMEVIVYEYLGDVITFDLGPGEDRCLP